MSTNETTTGNAAKLREALELAKSTFETLIQFQGDWHFVKCWATLGRNAMVSALAAPARNCDIGTADEQTERFVSFCDKNGRIDGVPRCEVCPLLNARDCSLVWAQMPSEEGGAR